MSATSSNGSETAADHIFAIVARPSRRSSLFWWLLENHDALVEAEVSTGLGLPWRELCAQFEALGLTSVAGGAVGRELAKKTWQRVRKEKKRLEARRAAAEAKRAARRAADPRGNMPSRWSGSFEAPLAERPAQSRSVAPSAARAPAYAAREDEPLDLEMFVRTDGLPEPWDDPDLTPLEKERVKKQTLSLRAQCWKKDKLFNPKKKGRR